MYTTDLTSQKKVRGTDHFVKGLAGFDEEGFEVCCRKIRVCLIRGDKEQAINVLRQFVGESGEPKLAFDTSVHDIGLTPQVSEILDSAGYFHLGSLLRVTAQDLGRLPRMQKKSIDEVLATVATCKRHIVAG